MNANTVVVGVDDSEGSSRMLEWLGFTLKGSDADVVAVHCVRPLLEELYALPLFDFEQWKADTVAAFETRWCAPLDAASVTYRTRVVEMEPAAGLQHVADVEDADLIVVGCQGYGRFGRGAIVAKLLAHGTRAVLVVPSRHG